MQQGLPGKLLRLGLLGTDAACATKEFSKDLTAPTTESAVMLKHLLS